MTSDQPTAQQTEEFDAGRAVILAIVAALGGFLFGFDTAVVSLGLAYGLYTAFALISFFFVLRFVPETKGKQLEEMA